LQGIQRLVERISEYLNALLGLEFNLHRAPRCVESRRPMRRSKNKSTRPLAVGGKERNLDRQIDEFIGASTDSPVNAPETPLKLGSAKTRIFASWLVAWDE
jgi:hypothetical protein